MFCYKIITSTEHVAKLFLSFLIILDPRATRESEKLWSRECFLTNAEMEDYSMVMKNIKLNAIAILDVHLNY